MRSFLRIERTFGMGLDGKKDVHLDGIRFARKRYKGDIFNTINPKHTTGANTQNLERGRRIDAAMLRTVMEIAFGASDADGAWTWKTAYDAREAATVLFLRKFGPAIRARAASLAAILPMLAKITALLPTHTRRSEESEALQQFSTPIGLG